MKDRILGIIENLFKLKSIVTLILTGVFAYLAVTGVIDGEKFLTIYGVIIAFYFGTQYQKGVNNKDAKN